jgi:hypothetical protein
VDQDKRNRHYEKEYEMLNESVWNGKVPDGIFRITGVIVTSHPESCGFALIEIFESNGLEWYILWPKDDVQIMKRLRLNES